MASENFIFAAAHSVMSEFDLVTAKSPVSSHYNIRLFYSNNRFNQNVVLLSFSLNFLHSSITCVRTVYCSMPNYFLILIVYSTMFNKECCFAPNVCTTYRYYSHMGYCYIFSSCKPNYIFLKQIFNLVISKLIHVFKCE